MRFGVKWAALALAFLAFGNAEAAEIRAVKITALVEHPALDDVRKGAIEELARQGYIDGEAIRVEFQSAQGEISTAGQIARKFVGDSPALIIAISTPSAQAAISAARGSVPIIFSAVSDPVGARLVKSWEHPGANVTGVSDRLPIEAQFALMREIVPDLKTIGVIYNSGEPNSITEVARLRGLADPLGIKIAEATAPNTNSVLIAARSLIGRADVLYVPTDNTVVSAFESVAKAAMDGKTPLIGGDIGSAARGAAAVVGFSYFDVGIETGKVAARILGGEKPGDISVQEVAKMVLVINPAAAAKMGLVLPETVLERADIVIKPD